MEKNSSGALNYYEYDASATKRLKTITNTSIPAGAAIVAYSQEFDCVILKGTSATQAFMINSSSSTATSIPGWADIVGSEDLSKTVFNTAVSASKVFTGSNCWAVQVDKLAFFKRVDGLAYTKSSLTFTTPSFDPSFYFVYDSGKVYKYNGTDYA